MVILGLALQSCKQEEPESMIRVATGATEQLELGVFLCHDAEPHQGCLSARVEGTDDLEITIEGDAFVLGGELTVTDDVVGVSVTAVSEGEAVLVVRYVSDDGRQTDRIALSSEEITHVVGDVWCSANRAGDRFAITTGSEFRFDLAAFAGPDPIASGDLALVADDDGVPVLSPPDVAGPGQAVAPDEAGPRRWTLAGDSEPVEFLFYEADALGVSLVAGNPGDDEDATLVQAIDGEPVCVHEGPAFATVAVTEGACRIAQDGFAFDGPMPVDLGRGNVALELLGTGSCTLEATTDDDSATLALILSSEDEPPQTLAGTPIGADPVRSSAALPLREVCPEIRPPTDGSCELWAIPGVIVLPSADCLFSARWAFRHHDPLGEPLPTSRVGTGLETELQVGAEYKLLGLFDWSAIPTTELRQLHPAARTDALGCVDDERRALALVVEKSGTFVLSFEASSLDETGTFTVTAEDVDHARFDLGGRASLGDGGEVPVFVGSVVPVVVDHFDASDTVLAGLGPFEVDTSDIADATLDGDRIGVGSTPGTLRLTSPNAPGSATIRTVDDRAVAEVDAASRTLAAGEIACLAATARAANGDEILGEGSSPVGIAIGGSALVVSAREPNDGAIHTICFEAFAPGATTIDVTWGGASTRAEWLVP